MSLPFPPDGGEPAVAVGSGPGVGSCRMLMTYADRLMTPFSWRTMSGKSFPSLVLVVAPSAGRAALGSSGFHAPLLLRSKYFTTVGPAHELSPGEARPCDSLSQANGCDGGPARR